MAVAELANCEALYTEAQLIQNFAVESKVESSRDLCKNVLKKPFVSSDCSAGYIFKRYIPIVDWLPKYRVRENLLRDALAGLTVGVVHLPQGLAYALLASLPPITGLYVSFFPVLVYMVFGTSRHISIGTFAVVSLMIAQIIDDKVPKCSTEAITSTLSPSTAVFSTVPTGSEGTNSTSSNVINCESTQDMRKIQIAVALSVVNGIIQIIMFISRLGVVTTYLSTTLVSGFTCAAAFHVVTSQVPKLLGIEVPRHSGPFALIYVYIDLFKGISGINWATFIVSLICIIFIICGKEINLRLKNRLPVPIPWELAVVIFSTLISYLCRLQSAYQVETVGYIPTGIKTSIPLMTDIGSVFIQALPITIVAFATEISLSQMFATKHSYDVKPDQELLAMGACNIIGCFFQCFPCAPSLSRSVICDEAGAKTQMNGFFSSVVILTILLWIGPLFESLPQAALASIIVVNLKNLLKQFEKIPQLWKVCWTDAIVWIVTWTSVVLLGVSVGLAVAVMFQIFSVIVTIQRTNASVLGMVGNSGAFRDPKKFHTSKESDQPGVIIIHFPVPLIYVNRQRFDRQIASALGFDPKLIKKLNPEISTVQETNEGRDIADASNNGAEVLQRRQSLESEDDGISLSHALTGDGDATHANTADRNFGIVKCLILDLSYCSFVDNDGVTVLVQLHKSLKQLRIKLFLSNCNDTVYRALRAHSQDRLPHCFLDIRKALEVATGAKTIHFDEGGNEETTV